MYWLFAPTYLQQISENSTDKTVTVIQSVLCLFQTSKTISQWWKLKHGLFLFMHYLLLLFSFLRIDPYKPIAANVNGLFICSYCTCMSFIIIILVIIVSVCSLNQKVLFNYFCIHASYHSIIFFNSAISFLFHTFPCPLFLCYIWNFIVISHSFLILFFLLSAICMIFF